MTKVNEKQEKFYKFLRGKERTNNSFTIDDVLKATGWKKSTFKSYYAKGQLSEFISENNEGTYEASNTLDISFKQFKKKLSQSKHIQSLGHNCKSKLAKALLHKSKDNMMLALELYNRPSLQNKLDGFVMMFCAAWEQLLKAILIEEHGESYIYKKGGKETISLRKAMDCFFDNNDKVKENILRIVDLRDKAVHLLMPEVQVILSRLFQSGVFNYGIKFQDFCEVPFLSATNTGMISLVGDFSLPPLSMLKNIYGSAAEDILALTSSLSSDIEKHNDETFAIPLNVTLQFAKKGEEGTEVILTKATEPVKDLKEALVIEKSVDAERTHPYRPGMMLKQVQKELNKLDLDALEEVLPSKKNGAPVFNMHCLQSCIYKLGWKKCNNEYHHYFEALRTHTYSQKAVDTIVKKVTENKVFLLNAKKSYSSKSTKAG